MGEMLAPSLLEGVSPRLLVLVQLVLATPLVLWGGWPFFVRGASSRSERRASPLRWRARSFSSVSVIGNALRLRRLAL
ncbi:MAG: hypothetical protein OEM67_00305 [Thermoleophilia bacterium]|nr:hypothetical protein [Thermoleophilia bacterium]